MYSWNIHSLGFLRLHDEAAYVRGLTHLLLIHGLMREFSELLICFDGHDDQFVGEVCGEAGITKYGR